MRPEALLEAACELAYEIARAGADADPRFDVPEVMNVHLRDRTLSDQALDAARAAIDEDPAFRRRVAEQAHESAVGRAGYLWLHRPIGWAAEFEDLVAEQTGGAGGLRHGTARGVAMASVESVPAVQERPVDEQSYGVPADDGDADTANEANAIENELSSLRGLVDRLANERKAVATSAERVEQEVHSSRQQPSVFETDVYTLQSELEAARADLLRSRQERDTAVQQHSAALTRQLDLEKELDAARERQADIERGHESADSEMVMLREQLARAEAAVQPLRNDSEALADQVDVLKTANAELTEQVEQSASARTEESRSAELQIHELEADLTDTRRLLDAAEAERERIGTELADVRSRLDATSAQSEDSAALVDVLTEEKIEVASRLADTESMLETTRSQLNNVRSDSEALAADLSTIKAHRDGLSTQVEDLHVSLSDALDNLARVRSTSDADRASLKEARNERDQLKVRVSSFEQELEVKESRLAAVSKDLEELKARHDDSVVARADAERLHREAEDARSLLKSDRDRSENALTEMTASRDLLRAELDKLRADLAEVQAVRDGLVQQVEQLTSENAAIQDQLVESDRLRVETSESQGRALAELAQRLSVTENERARLEGELKTGGASVSALSSRTDAKTESDEDDDEVEEKPARRSRSSASTARKKKAPVEEELDEAEDDDLDADAEDEPSTELASISELVPTDDAVKVERDASRTTNRHNWSLGPLRRGRKGESLPEDGTGEVEMPLPSGPGPGDAEEDEFEAIAAAVAEATQDLADDQSLADEIPEDDLDAVSNGLAEALGREPEPPKRSEEDDELDAISDLISQTVSDMRLNENGAGASLGAMADHGSRGPDTKPPSIFSQAGDDGVDPSVFEDDPLSPGRSGPPSVLDGPRSGGVVSRRQISIPEELLDDEVELARHIVSSPDVVLLVDGDSVARMGWPSLPVVQQRDALVSYLADLSASSGVAPDIVFDGRQGEEDSLPASRAVRIRLSTPPTEPAAALDELVDAYPEQWPIAIVTDDEVLAASASERGAAVLNNGQLLDLFIGP